MKSTRFIFIAFLALIVFTIVNTSTFFVDEREQVILTQFGKPVGNAINSDPNKNEAGLHFKIPFIQTANRIEKRIIEWDGPATEMPTRDKLYITVDNFARWRITDPLKFLESLRDVRSAISRLDDIIGGATRSVIAKHDLIEVIRTDQTRAAVLPEDIISTGIPVSLPKIRFGRKVLEREIVIAARSKAEAWGIELIDVRFKRINYKAGVIDKIYDRMRSERQQIASKFVSEGEGEAAKIKGRTEKELLTIQSEAYRKEQEIKGKADAEATQIYANAYNTSPLAADFYQFIKTLETYQKTMDSSTTAVFTTESDLFRLLKRIDSSANNQAPKNP